MGTHRWWHRQVFGTSLLWISLVLLAIAVGACAGPSPPKLTIATASNMQYAMAELSDAFTASTGIPCQPIFSASGKLTAQIKAGAPFDLFLSADLEYPEQLYQDALTLNPPQIYAYGKLVLWTMNPQITPSIERLQNEDIRHIGIANPKIAPYGRAALESLKSLQLDPQIQNKLIYGETINQVNQFIHTQVVDLGFTAKSTVLSSPLVNQGRWTEIDDQSYRPIAQGVVMIKNDRAQSQNAQKFQDFLFSTEGQTILQAHGYATETVIEAP